MTTIKLPNGKKLDVIPAEQIKVGAYRRMKKFDALIADQSGDPEKEMELLDTCVETLQYLVPTLTEEDLDNCTLNELGTLLQEAMQAMSQGAGLVDDDQDDEVSAAPKARRRKPKTLK